MNPNRFFYIHNNKILRVAAEILPELVIGNAVATWISKKVVSDSLDIAEELVKEWYARSEASRTSTEKPHPKTGEERK